MAGQGVEPEAVSSKGAPYSAVYTAWMKCYITLVLGWITVET